MLSDTPSYNWQDALNVANFASSAGTTGGAEVAAITPSSGSNSNLINDFFGVINLATSFGTSKTTPTTVYPSYVPPSQQSSSMPNWVIPMALGGGGLLLLYLLLRK